ncbi:MAG: PDZ domain-containing protein, partial [Pyrinomonadaceae bacterium]
IENAAVQVCPGCDIHGFFNDHIYGAKQIDFDRYLSLIGLRAEVARSPALNADRSPAVDRRIAPLASDSDFKIRITNPQSAWGRAGLHTGDTLLSVDGTRIATWSDLRSLLQAAKIGDVAHLRLVHDGVTREVDVPITGYDTATVKISELAGATPTQMLLRDAWSKGN